jgi:hypothetical protein
VTASPGKRGPNTFAARLDDVGNSVMGRLQRHLPLSQPVRRRSLDVRGHRRAGTCRVPGWTIHGSFRRSQPLPSNHMSTGPR